MWKKVPLGGKKRKARTSVLSTGPVPVGMPERGTSAPARKPSLRPFALGALLCIFGSHPLAAEVTSPTDLDRVVAVDSVHSELGHVTGVISNRSSLPVLEVTLLIQQTYLRPNEFKPRGESPSRALVRHIAGPIAPGQSLRFDEVVPSRGTFETRAMILDYRYQSDWSDWMGDLLAGC
jgi:hypothetical protein